MDFSLSKVPKRHRNALDILKPDIVQDHLGDALIVSYFSTSLNTAPFLFFQELRLASL